MPFPACHHAKWQSVWTALVWLSQSCCSRMGISLVPYTHTWCVCVWGGSTQPSVQCLAIMKQIWVNWSRKYLRESIVCCSFNKLFWGHENISWVRSVTGNVPSKAPMEIWRMDDKSIQPTAADETTMAKQAFRLGARSLDCQQKSATI